ncbi:hypothetical protein J4Q44_G00143880 [Coregonus suidteri]|uniref:Sushi domain-containing protein n=1 Tax=Coregonus suidteri TaxID=861788 RepID=A0AAN8LRT1_9TELE
MQLCLISLLLIIKVCRLSTVRRDVCPPPSQLNLTKPLNGYQENGYQENSSLRYQCVDGYVRKAGTSNLIRCKRTDQKLEWTRPTLICIPDPSIPTTIEPSTTHKTTPSPTTHLSVPTKRVSPRPTTPSSPISQTLHPITGTQEVNTTVTVTTIIIDDITSVSAPTPSESTEKSSATVIYAGVGVVVVTILLAAAIGVLMFWRRKGMQRLDLSPTKDEMEQMNVVT